MLFHHCVLVLGNQSLGRERPTSQLGQGSHHGLQLAKTIHNKEKGGWDSGMG